MGISLSISTLLAAGSAYHFLSSDGRFPRSARADRDTPVAEYPATGDPHTALRWIYCAKGGRERCPTLHRIPAGSLQVTPITGTSSVG